MAQAPKQPDPKPAARPQKPPPHKLDFNKDDDWAAMRSQWAKEQVERIQAHANRFFVTDDELHLGHHMQLVVIGLFVFVFIAWANFATLDEVTKGQGKIIPSSEIQIVQSLEGGIIDEILVHEGDEVAAGQPLVRLRDVQAASDLGSNRQHYLGLQAKIIRLKAEADGLPTPQFTEEVMKGAPEGVKEEMDAFRANQNNLVSQTQVLQSQMSQRQQEVREIETKLADLRGVLRLAQEQHDMVAPLVARGSAPKVELLQLEQNIKEKQTELNAAQTALPRARAAVNEAQARINELISSNKAQAQTELSAASIEMATIRETLSGLRDKKQRTELKSPVNGTIKDLKFNTIGGVVQPGQDILEIVPKDDQLLVEAQIRPADIAFLHPKQAAVVKLTAYDFSIYGGLKGEVVGISADTIANQKGETFYRVKVRTKENTLKRRGEVLPIIPGMVATVDILTGRKTVMEYILKPLIKTLDGAMKER
jgi:adhesin transport system membrane fusion protein